MTNYDVVTKLIGKIEPTGESNTDRERYVNLKYMCELVDKLMFDIRRVKNYGDSRESSVKIAGEYAKKFIRETVTIYNEADL